MDTFCRAAKGGGFFELLTFAACFGWSASQAKDTYEQNAAGIEGMSASLYNIISTQLTHVVQHSAIHLPKDFALALQAEHVALVVADLADVSPGGCLAVHRYEELVLDLRSGFEKLEIARPDLMCVSHVYAKDAVGAEFIILFPLNHTLLWCDYKMMLPRCFFVRMNLTG